MLIAVFLATVIHIGLMNFEFDLKPVFVPSVSLPRSVSVILGQRKVVETPVIQKEKTQTAEPLFEELPETKTEPEKPVVQKVIAVKEKKYNPLQQPVLPEKTVMHSIVEKSIPASQRSESIEKDLAPEPVNAAKAQATVATAEKKDEQEDEGGALAGIVQMAYPRYQLNTPPPYPGLARKRGQEGTVILRVLVNSEGRVDDLEIENSSGFGLLDRAAVSSVRKWSFEPGRRGKVKISMRVRVPVTFKLKK
jgi:protein TonB